MAIRKGSVARLPGDPGGQGASVEGLAIFRVRRRGRLRETDVVRAASLRPGDAAMRADCSQDGGESARTSITLS